MKSVSRLMALSCMLLAIALSIAWGIATSDSACAQEPATNTKASAKNADEAEVSLAVAKERLSSVSKVYLSALEVMHDRYFHGERAMVPARAMEDVFADMERELGISSRWIAVNTKAMSVSHEPKTEFEIRAAEAIEQGKPHIEETVDGTYSLAVSVPLASKCVNCHAGMFREPPKKKLFAGLVLKMPLSSHQGQAK